MNRNTEKNNQLNDNSITKKSNINFYKDEKTNIWKWSNGSFFEKSKRPKNIQKHYQENRVEYGNQFQFNQEKSDNETLRSALDSGDSLADLNYKGEILSLVQGQELKKKTNKREQQNEKFNSRHMMIQKGLNPFINSNNYVEHLDTESNFLRPRDSNYN